MEKIGITTHATQRGKNAGTTSMMRGFSEDEAKQVKESMAAVYETFKKRVTDGRGKALKGDLENLAGGRVYSGKDALAVGLVDELGGLHEALAWAGNAAKLEKPEFNLVPEPKSGLEGMFAPEDKKDDDEIIRATVKSNAATALQSMIKSSNLLDTLPGPARAAVSRLVSRMDAFQKTQVLLIGPDMNLR
jgi:protease-4